MDHARWLRIWIATLALCLLAGARTAAAQAILIEPFAGVGSERTLTTGVSVWRTGTEVIGLRGSAAWIRSLSDDRSGGVAQAGLIFAAPVAGGPPIRPFIGLELGVAKLEAEGAYPFFRPAIGVVARPGARWSYVVETGVSWNRDRSTEWSLIGGIMLSRPRRRP